MVWAETAKFPPSQGSKKKERASRKDFLSVCLAPLWGSAPKWLLLIEFIEYYRLQGVEHS
ncbi:hypothetical protein COOONC_19581 [Cooperia oncophora]